MEALKKYKTMLGEIERKIETVGKEIGEACAEHPSLYLYCYNRFSEVHRIHKMAVLNTNKVHALLYKDYMENHSRGLSHNSIQSYIPKDDEYIEAKKIELEIKELLDKFQGVMVAMESRGYQLNNITKLRVNEIEKGLL